MLPTKQSIKEDDPERVSWSDFHFNLLDEKKKREYLNLTKCLSNGSLVVRVYGIKTMPEMVDLINAVRLDHPELCNLQVTSVRWFNDVFCTSELSMKRTYSEQMFEEKMSDICKVVEHIRDETEGMPDIEKEIYIHDYLCSTVVYDNKEPDQFTIIGPLTKGKGTCTGISSAATYLLNSVGIWSGTLTGNIPGSRFGHAWNVVSIEGHRYHLDVTMDIIGKDSFSHNYLNMSDKMISKDGKHNWKESYFSTSETMHNYHRMKGLYAENIEEMIDIMDKNAIEKGAVEIMVSPQLNESISEEDLIRAYTYALRKKGLYCTFRFFFNEKSGCCIFETYA